MIHHRLGENMCKHICNEGLVIANQIIKKKKLKEKKSGRFEQILHKENIKVVNKYMQKMNRFFVKRT